jgi:NAD(P)-dependent dehydrogenase (short-subunit alcohol dehydrogenase family)
MPKTWLITGSSRGLGRAIAEAVLESGDRLVATARRPEQLADLAERYGERVRTIALDVTDRARADAAVQAALDAFAASTAWSTTRATATSRQSRRSRRTTSARRSRRTSGARST